MKIIVAKRRSSLFIRLSRDEIIYLILASISRIFTGRNYPKSRVAFTVGIDATAIVKAYQVSTSDCEIFGGASLNDFIPVDVLLKE